MKYIFLILLFLYIGVVLAADGDSCYYNEECSQSNGPKCKENKIVNVISWCDTDFNICLSSEQVWEDCGPDATCGSTGGTVTCFSERWGRVCNSDADCGLGSSFCYGNQVCIKNDYCSSVRGVKSCKTVSSSCTSCTGGCIVNGDKAQCDSFVFGTDSLSLPANDLEEDTTTIGAVPKVNEGFSYSIGIGLLLVLILAGYFATSAER